ncbi:MAG: hypothetical protein H0U57_15065 [Tatlockia sp.]|nr:hypothetical protein [Tatlockia sp.]
MNFQELAAKLIPGYDLLSKDQMDEFEATEAGQLFITVVNDLLIKINPKNEEKSFFSYAYSIASTLLSSEYEQKKENLKTEYAIAKKNLIDQIKDSLAWKNLISMIIFNFLEEQFFDFSVLTVIQQEKLTKARFSLPLQSQYLLLEEQKKETDNLFLLAQLDTEQEAIYQQWLDNFKIEEEMGPLHDEIAMKKGLKRVEKLAQLLPILNERQDSLKSSSEIFLELYCEESKKEMPDFDGMEEQFLTHLIFMKLQKTTAKSINFVDLKDFDKKIASSFARDIIRASIDDDDPRVEAQIASYGYALRNEIRKRRLLINNKMLEVDNNKEDEGLLNSLSYLFWNSNAVNKSKLFLNKMADAHAFIQYTGMSTQNENSYFAVLDLYNYGRSAEQITETASIFSSLLKPFLPLYEEYKEIAFYEKSGFRKVVRALIPILIVAGIIVLVGTMLSPLAIPEFAFLIAAIPVLLIGLYIASKYVSWKNEIYHYVYQNWLNDGAFEIPEFQVNQRMIETFGTKEKAELVRSIYIEELKFCDDLENSFREKEVIGGTDQELELRKENIKKRHTLCLEWYDIHSNTDLGYDKVPKLVQERFKTLLNEEILGLERDCEDIDDLREIDNLIKDVVSDLTIDFIPPQNPQNNELRLEPEVALQNNVNRFFQPKSLEHQKKAEKIDQALTMILQ